MDDDEDEQQVTVAAAVRMDWVDGPLIVLGLVADILEAFNTAAVRAQMILAMHGNWRLERRRFRTAVDRDIDELTRGRTDDAG